MLTLIVIFITLNLGCQPVFDSVLTFKLKVTFIVYLKLELCVQENYIPIYTKLRQ